MTTFTRLAGALVGVIALTTACGGSPADPATAGADVGATDNSPTNDGAAMATSEGAGVRVVSAEDAKAITDDPPPDLVILDVRTPEEFAGGHLEGAMLIDFYANDFAEQLAALDPSVPYVLYCRSGNRSQQAAAMMADLGFRDVADVDGGIAAWADRGFPVTR